MRTKIFAVILVTVGINSCTKIDYIDDATVEQKIVVNNLQVALKVNDSSQITADYYNQFGVKTQVPFEYTSSKPSIVKVDNTGKIIALAVGSSVIQASYKSFLGPLVNVNVVANDLNVALVQITAPSTSIAPGSKVLLSAVVKTISGSILTGRTIEWFSENASLMTVSSSGEATALAIGVVGIHAKVDGVKSNSIDFSVSTVRRGTFVKAGGYQTEGTTTLGVENGRLLLKLESDFQTSFALGTYVYLANSTNGSTVRSGGLEIAQITTNGAKTFDLSTLFPAVKIKDYKYVVILCKPASLTFGYADLN
jgi:hypothetical protein